MKTAYFLIGLSMLAIIVIASYEWGEKNTEIKYIKDTDTLVVYKTIHDTIIKPKFYTVVKKDTIKTIDSIYYTEENEYVAEVDTAYEQDLLKLKVKYISDIPLSKRSYFNIDADVKKETIFIPTKVDPSWWFRRFGFFLGAGYGYDLNTKKVNPQVNISFGINLF